MHHCAVPLSERFENARLLAWVSVATIAIALLVRFFVFPVYEIPSLSMADTLDRGDRILVNRFGYQFGDIERGEVVVFDTPPGLTSEADVLVKRVIGLPGEAVRIVDNEVYVDGLLVVEPYLRSPSSTDSAGRRIPGCDQDTASVGRCRVPDGYVFVMGDNRSGSTDSRFFGPVAIDSIVGRAFVQVWPVSSISRL